MIITQTEKVLISQILKELSEKISFIESGPKIVFKQKAYLKAAQNIEKSNVNTLDEIQQLPGIGPSIFLKIREILTTGTLYQLYNYTNDYSKLLTIDDVGPVKAKHLFETYKVKTPKDVEVLIKQGKIVDEKLTRNVERALQLRDERLPREKMLEFANPILIYLIIECSHAIVEIAGSIRRELTTCKDVDILICDNTKELDNARTVFKNYEWDLITADGKVRIDAIKDGIAVNGWFLPRECYGSGLLHCTGSGEFNQVLRHIAKEKGYKLSEYGLRDRNTDIIIELWSEQSIFEHLGLQFIHPKNRIPEFLNKI